MIKLLLLKKIIYSSSDNLLSPLQVFSMSISQNNLSPNISSAYPEIPNFFFLFPLFNINRIQKQIPVFPLMYSNIKYFPPAIVMSSILYARLQNLKGYRFPLQFTAPHWFIFFRQAIINHSVWSCSNCRDMNLSATECVAHCSPHLHGLAKSVQLHTHPGQGLCCKCAFILKLRPNLKSIRQPKFVNWTSFWIFQKNTGINLPLDAYLHH